MKTAEGWLCASEDGGEVSFFPNDGSDVWVGPYGWQRDSDPYCWGRDAFLTAYDMLDDQGKPCALPKPGTKFLVDMDV